MARKYAERKLSLVDAVSEAFSEITNLAEEEQVNALQF